MTSPDPSTVCGQRCARCLCLKAPGHEQTNDPVHACDPDTCGGSWVGVYGQDGWEVVTLPHPDIPVSGLELLVAAFAQRACRICGCTDERACLPPAGPCHWVEQDLCSACANG